MSRRRRIIDRKCEPLHSNSTDRTLTVLCLVILVFVCDLDSVEMTSIPAPSHRDDFSTQRQGKFGFGGITGKPGAPRGNGRGCILQLRSFGESPFTQFTSPGMQCLGWLRSRILNLSSFSFFQANMDRCSVQASDRARNDLAVMALS